MSYRDLTPDVWTVWQRFAAGLSQLAPIGSPARRHWERPSSKQIFLRAFWELKHRQFYEICHLRIYDLLVPFYRAPKAEGRDAAPGFVFAFFTCKRDFLDLKYALLSLAGIDLDGVRRVFVIIDKADPLDAAEMAELKEIFPDRTTFGCTKHRNRKGLRRILSQLHAYREAIREMDADSYLVKCDSDIVFTSKRIFETVRERGGDLVGQPCFGVYDHTQGGCYFLSHRILKQILATRILRTVRTTCRRKQDRRPAKCPEDAFFFTLVSELEGDLQFVSFYVPKKEIPTFELSETGEYSLIHFQGKRTRESKMRVWEQVGT